MAETAAPGWDTLALWGDDARRIRPLTGGTSNDVWLVTLRGQRAVARLGTRTDADLLWEADLLLHLNRHGLTVPLPLPTTDGRLFADGLMVMTFMTGQPPRTSADWRRVAETLRSLHRLTIGWPQRPGWRASTDLLQADLGTRIDLTALPTEATIRCRAAWARLVGRDPCVVHGNPTNPANILMTATHVALIDWDEARLDIPDLDLALPYNAADLPARTLDTATQAAAAWEAAICWDDAYARSQLAKVRAVPTRGQG